MITIGDIVDLLDAGEALHELAGRTMDIPITRPAPIADAKKGDFSFCGSTAKYPLEMLAQTRASLIIVDRKIPVDKAALTKAGVQALILSENARLDFIRVVERFFAQPRTKGRHPSAVIAPSAEIESNVSIGSFCTIGEDVKIGENTVLYSGVHIYDQVQIGRDVTIHSGTAIGKDGWGFERNQNGQLVKFPHIGSVEIGDDVEIGSNVVIDRATLGKTLIRRGCKINNGVHIAHNVEVGENTIIHAQAYLGGSSKVGERCWIGPHSAIRNKIQIGSEVFIGMGSIVTRDVSDGATIMGSPARKLKNQKKLLAHWNDVITRLD